MARKALPLGNGSKEISLEKAKAEARKAYEILEQQVTEVEQSGSPNCYLLGTKQPTVVDALLITVPHPTVEETLRQLAQEFPHIPMFGWEPETSSK